MKEGNAQWCTKRQISNNILSWLNPHRIIVEDFKMITPLIFNEAGSAQGVTFLPPASAILSTSLLRGGPTLWTCPTAANCSFIASFLSFILIWSKNWPFAHHGLLNSVNVIKDWQNLPDIIFGDLMMMVGLEILETLNTCRQVCRSLNKMIVSNEIL